MSYHLGTEVLIGAGADTSYQPVQPDTRVLMNPYPDAKVPIVTPPPFQPVQPDTRVLMNPYPDAKVPIVTPPPFQPVQTDTRVPIVTPPPPVQTAPAAWVLPPPPTAPAAPAPAPTAPAAPAPAAPAASYGQDVLAGKKALKRGMRDNVSDGDIKYLQTTLLPAAGLQVTADPADFGIFGPKTEAVVKAYQKQAGLSVDGKVGKSTWQALLRTLQAQQQVMGAIPPNSALSYSIVGGTALTAAVAAALLWKKHRAIGFFSGLNVGYGLGEVFTGRYVSGVSQVLVGAAGAAAGAAWSNSKGHDNLRGAFGYIGGTLAATTVTLPIVFKLRK